MYLASPGMADTIVEEGEEGGEGGEGGKKGRGGERTLWMKGWHLLDERGREPSGWRGWYPLDGGEGLRKSKGWRFCVLKAVV